MAKVISISNQKGGVGKTTTTLALSVILRNIGFKVLAIDLDAQCNLSYAMGADSNEHNTIYNVMLGECTASSAVQKLSQCDIISASILLAAADREFSKTGSEYLIKEAIADLRPLYDYIIIDTPPALGILTINAFTSSDYIIIPVGADIFSIQGTAQLKDTYDTVKRYCNDKLEIAGILLTKHNDRTILSRELTNEIKKMAEQLNTKVFKSFIRESISIKEAQTMQTSLLEYAPRSNSTQDYINFANEVIKKLR